MVTTTVAAADLISISHQIYYVAAGVGGTFALVTGIFVGLRNSWRHGIGAGIGAFFMGVFFSILIANAVGVRDIGTNEIEQRTGIHNNTPYGQ